MRFHYDKFSRKFDTATHPYLEIRQSWQKDIENELTPLTVLHPHHIMLLSISVINHQRIFQDDSLCIQEVSFEYLDDSDKE